MPTLSQYRTIILAILNDASLDKYTNDQVDQALRQALETYSFHKPRSLTWYLDCDGNKRVPLPADFSASRIIRIEWFRSDPDVLDQVGFYAVRIDDQWYIEMTGQVLPSGEVLTIEYETLHLIDGLDSASASTVPTDDVHLLAMGAAGYAARSRAHAKTEANNLNPQEARDLSTQSLAWLNDFTFRLGMPDKGFYRATWQDGTIDRNY